MVPNKERSMSRLKRLVAMTITGVALSAAAGVTDAQQPSQPTQSPQPQAGQPSTPQAAELTQIALTDKQIQGLLDAQRDMDAIMSKLPDDPSKPPDANVMAQLDAVAKKHGFASYAEYGNVAANVDMMLDGFDPQTKKFVGFEVVVKDEIAQIQADTRMPSKDKKEALDELNAALKNVPTVKFPANIELVGKYYDKLNDALRAQE
jgi:hypothetical protein